MRHWQLFVASFKRLDNDYLKMLLLDLINYMGLYGLIFLLQRWTAGQLSALNALQSSALTNLDVVENTIEAQQYTGAISGFIIKSIIITFLFCVSVLALWSLCKGMIYSILLKKPFTTKAFFLFAWLNVIWGLIWAAFIIIVLRFLVPEAAVILLGILLLLWLYLTFFLYYGFTIHQSVRKAFTQLFPLSIGRIPHLFFPYLLALLTFIVLLVVSLVFNLLPEQLSIIISPLLLIAYIAWLRIYVVGILHETNTKEHTTK